MRWKSEEEGLLALTVFGRFTRRNCTTVRTNPPTRPLEKEPCSVWAFV